MDSGSEWSRGAYAMINLALIALSVFLGRQAYAVFGGLGLCMYVGDLAHRVFEDSLLFPFALSLIGVAAIALGLQFFRHQARIEAAIDRAIPPVLLRLRPPHARSVAR